MNSPEDDIPLPSEPILSEEETARQMREDTHRTCHDKDRIKTKEINTLVQESRMLHVALEESVKLQSHYAKLLNMHDGGQRIGFVNAASWIARLKVTGTIK